MSLAGAAFSLDQVSATHTRRRRGIYRSLLIVPETNELGHK